MKLLEHKIFEEIQGLGLSMEDEKEVANSICEMIEGYAIGFLRWCHKQKLEDLMNKGETELHRLYCNSLVIEPVNLELNDSIVKCPDVLYKSEGKTNLNNTTI